MYTIFFTINCVEQLTFFKTFVDKLQFEQSLIFLSKIETARNTHTAHDFQPVVNFFDICSNGVEQLFFLSSSFFKLSQFEQLNITRLEKKNVQFVKLENCYLSYVHRVLEQYNLSYFQKLITVFALEH
jgi:hypothetical protein